MVPYNSPNTSLDEQGLREKILAQFRNNPHTVSCEIQTTQQEDYIIERTLTENHYPKDFYKKSVLDKIINKKIVLMLDDHQKQYQSTCYDLDISPIYPSRNLNPEKKKMLPIEYEYKHTKRKTTEIIETLEKEQDSPILSKKSSSTTSKPKETLHFQETLFETGKFEKLFQDQALIGRGAFGEVFRAKHKIENQEYAIKRVYFPIGKEDEVFSHRFLKEQSILKPLNHKNVIRYYSFWIEMPSDSFLEKFQQEFEKNQRSLSSR